MASEVKKLNYLKTNRLRTKSEFEAFFAQAKHVVLGTTKVFYVRGQHPSRLGISVSSKFFNSVKRNSLKRQIREFFRHNKDTFNNIDVVISIRYSMMAKDNWVEFKRRVLRDTESVLKLICKR